MIFWLFLFGLIAGSFLNVVAVRYDPEKFILSPRVIGGRSRCPHCGRTLSFFELVPLLSFLAQAGRCRKCRAKISPQYPLMEILCGLVFVFVPYAISKLSYAFGFHLAPWLFLSLCAVWILALLTLLVVAVIDIRLRLIPDEANIFLAVLGIIFIALKALGAEGVTGGSFVGSYALLFGFQENVYVNHGIALLFGAVFFGFLIAITRGRGMGMGDLKLATALGVLFGWPDIVFVVALAFIMGAVVGLGAIILGKKGMKSFLPFGPFLVAGAALVFFFGYPILVAYFKLFPV